MSWRSGFIFRIIIGLLFIAEYFVGFDGHGRGAGNIITLLFGAAFAGYGFFGFVQREALRKKAVAKYGLPSDASWEAIGQAIEERQAKKQR
jgi:hypothetical protein